jgi:hypothetical protein
LILLSRVFYTFGVFCVVVVLVAALMLREANSHMFYQLRVYKVEENHLKQQLWQKQLRLESLTQPQRVLEATVEDE